MAVNASTLRSDVTTEIDGAELRTFAVEDRANFYSGLFLELLEDFLRINLVLSAIGDDGFSIAGREMMPERRRAQNQSDDHQQRQKIPTDAPGASVMQTKARSRRKATQAVLR